MCSIPSYRQLKYRGEGYAGRMAALVLFFLLSLKGFGQDEKAYDEVPVLFSVPRIGHTELLTLIKNEEAYIPVKEVFDYLKIKNTPSGHLDSLSGFFIDPKAIYVIDKTNHRIEYGEKVFELTPSDLVQTETGLYLRSEIFCKVFGLDCRFSFRNLAFTLTTNIELPALREMQQEQMRKNLNRLKGEKKADTIIKEDFSFFHFGMADWSLTATQETNRPRYLRAGLSLGATLAGGEALVNLNYDKDRPFHPGQQFYRWRYVNNGLSLVKQVSAGRLVTPSVSSLFAPVNGIQVTNTPTLYRKSFGTYRYTGTTEPEWMVELYVNNVLINYVRADASGFYAFDIPIVYGNSAIRLKFYGPWGEENTKEEAITVPFNFLPLHQLEYTTSAGVVQDATHSRFSRAAVNYGLGRRITLGGGAEYLSSVMEGRPMPFVNASLRLGTGLILNGEFVQGVKAGGALHYRLPSNVQLDLSYTKFNETQTAIRYNYLEVRKASVSFPVRLKKFTAFSRLSYNRYLLPKFRYGNAEFLVSAAIAGISSNLRTYIQFSEQVRTDAYTSLSLSFRLPYGIRLSPQVQYQYNTKNFSTIKADAEKKISPKGYLNLSYETNRYLHSSAFTLGLRYDLSFARTFFSVRRGNKTTAATQWASGSLVYEKKAGYAALDNRTTVGRGGFIILPFLDLNCNNRKDRGEPRVSGLNLRVNGGHIEQRPDSSLLVTGLEAYTPYFIELDKNSFDNIAWQIKNTTIRATVTPNRLKLIEVPVAVVGEASGMVYLKSSRQQKGLSRILVNFYDSSHKRVAQTLTEGDGYFSYLGLTPGFYTARIDTAQLHMLNLACSPQTLSFTIAGSEEGTIADGFEFVLRSLNPAEEKPADTPSGKRSPVRDNSPAAEQAPGSGTRAAVQKNLQQTDKRAGQNRSPENGVPAGSQKNVEARKEDSSFAKEQRDPVPRKPDAYRVKKKVPVLSSGHRPPVGEQGQRSTPKKSQTVKKQTAAKKQNLSPIRQELIKQEQRLDKRHRQASEKLQQLLQEQQQLIKKQKELLEEIRQLRLKLLKKQKSVRRTK